jgi:hypothetical protein
VPASHSGLERSIRASSAVASVICVSCYQDGHPGKDAGSRADARWWTARGATGQPPLVQHYRNAL